MQRNRIQFQDNYSRTQNPDEYGAERKFSEALVLGR